VQPSLQALLDMNRQLVQKVLDKPAQTPAVDPVQAEIAQAVKNRDFATLEKHGLNLQDWTDATMAELSGDPKEKELYELRQKVSQFEQWKAAQEQEKQEYKRQQEAARVARIENETKSVIQETLEKDPNTRILLTLAGGVEDVYKVIEQHVLQTQRRYGQPQWMDPREAAKMVLDKRGPEIDRLFEVARENPNYHKYFSPQGGQQPTATVQPPSPGVTGSQLRGSGGAGTQDQVRSKEEAILSVINRFMAR
jgi:hypothetical protein